MTKFMKLVPITKTSNHFCLLVWSCLSYLNLFFFFFLFPQLLFPFTCLGFHAWAALCYKIKRTNNAAHGAENSECITITMPPPSGMCCTHLMSAQFISCMFSSENINKINKNSLKGVASRSAATKVAFCAISKSFITCHSYWGNCSVNCINAMQHLENCTKVKVMCSLLYLIKYRVQHRKIGKCWPAVGVYTECTPTLHTPSSEESLPRHAELMATKLRLSTCANLMDLNGNTAQSRSKPVWSMAVCLSACTRPAHACCTHVKTNVLNSSCTYRQKRKILLSQTKANLHGERRDKLYWSDCYEATPFDGSHFKNWGATKMSATDSVGTVWQ